MNRVIKSLGRGWRERVEALTQKKKTLGEGERQKRDNKIDRVRVRQRERPMEGRDRERQNGNRDRKWREIVRKTVKVKGSVERELKRQRQR